MLVPPPYPWIASESFDGHRILIVGESHYGVQYANEWDHCRMTRSVVRGYMTCDWDSGFFTRITHVLWRNPEGQRGWADPKTREVWKRVSFCNYIQRMLPGREDKTDNDFIESMHRFRRIVHAIDPDGIMVFGKQAGRHISEHHLLPGGLPFRHTAHPAAFGRGGFTYEKAIAKFRSLLDELTH